MHPECPLIYSHVQDLQTWRSDLHLQPPDWEGLSMEAEEPPSSSSTTAEPAGKLSLADQREVEAYAAADSVGDELLQQHVRVHWTCERRWFRGTCDATCHENGRRLHHISCTPQLVRTLS